MPAAEHIHEAVLRLVDVLELVDHDVLEALLPLLADVLVLGEDVQRELDEVVVVEAEALLLFIEIAVEENVLLRLRPVVLLLERGERQSNELLVVVGLLHELAHLEHVARLAVRHIAQGQAALLIDLGEHVVDVGVVEHEETLRVADGMAVLLQDGDAEAVERVDVARVVVARQGVNAAAHLCRRLVGKRHAEDVARQDAELLDEVGKAMRERPRLPGTRARQHTHKALCRRHRLALRIVEPLEQILPIFHIAAPPDPVRIPFHSTTAPPENNKNFTCQ